MKNYHPLHAGDIIAAGDQFLNADGTWTNAVALVNSPVPERTTFRRPIKPPQVVEVKPDAIVPDYPPEHRAIIRELLDRMNVRRQRKGRKPVGFGALPSYPASALHATDYYLVDTYSVRRHWRRRPIRTQS